MSGQNSVATPRLSSLTGLRFFAALAVVMHHTGYLLLGGTWVAAATAPGFVGVTFFFVLSGFVLTWTFRPTLSPRHFYGRRFARVGPLHLMTAGAALAYLCVIGTTPGRLPTLTNLLLLQSWIPDERFGASLNPVSWSLSCEAFFYLLFPLLVRLMRRLPIGLALAAPIAWLVLGAALVVILDPTQAESLLYKFPLYRIGEFAFGIALALGLGQGRWQRLRLPAAVLIACTSFAGLLFVLTLLPGVGVTPIRAYTDIAALPGVAVLLTAAARSDLGGARSWFARPIMVLLGEASFALYLIHFIVLDAWARFAEHPDPGALGLAAVVVVVVLLTLGSIAVYRCVEAPLEGWLRARLGTPRREPDVRHQASAAATPSIGASAA